MQLDTETFFLRDRARCLSSAWHSAGATPKAAVLFCHPLGEEMKCSRRAFVETAKALQRRNVSSLVFDMSGCGDSDGEFENYTLPSWLDDIAAAWDELGKRAPGVPRALVGLRFGAALAAISCARLENVESLILWQPIISGKAEFSSALRRVLIQQMIVEGAAETTRNEMLKALETGTGYVVVDGYSITGTLYQDLCRLDLAANHPEFPPQTGVVQFTRPNKRISDFAEAAKISSAVVDVPPIWIRSDFMPNKSTGDLLATEGILPWLTES